MKIFYNKLTGDAIGTIDGFSDEQFEGITMTPSGVDPKDVGVVTIGLGHPDEQLARDIMDGTKPDITVETIKFDPSIKKIRPFTGKEQVALKAKKDKDKADHEAWLAANPPMDPIAEITKLQADIAKLKANNSSNPKP